ANATATAEAPKPATAAPAAKPDKAAAPAKAEPQMVEIPSGTSIHIILTDAISSGKNNAGDTFMASLADPIVVNGETVVPRGATVKGRVIDAKESGRIKGKASISLGLTSIVAGGKTYSISTRAFEEEAESTKKRDGGLIAGAGGVGAAIGALAGGGNGAV